MKSLSRFWRPLLLVCVCTAACAQDRAPVLIRLWDQAAPGALGDEPKDRPSIDAYLPDPAKAVGTGVLVCPGGGYGGLASGHEGKQIAEWLNARGVAAFVLKYRMRKGGYGHPAPLLDAQRALRIVRTRATEFGVDPARIGIMGFSAGGHLASTVGTHFDDGAPDSTDIIERAGSRPDFMILCYAVITLGEPSTHRGSQFNLLGANADPELIRSLSNEKQVTEKTPPTFLFHTSGDAAVPPENSVVFYQALQKHKVPAELHIYQNGPHGVGLAANIPGTSDWPETCLRWLSVNHLLPAAKLR